MSRIEDASYSTRAARRPGLRASSHTTWTNGNSRGNFTFSLNHDDDDTDPSHHHHRRRRRRPRTPSETSSDDDTSTSIPGSRSPKPRPPQPRRTRSAGYDPRDSMTRDETRRKLLLTGVLTGVVVAAFAGLHLMSRQRRGEVESHRVRQCRKEDAFERAKRQRRRDEERREREDEAEDGEDEKRGEGKNWPRIEYGVPQRERERSRTRRIEAPDDNDNYDDDDDYEDNGIRDSRDYEASRRIRDR